MPQDTAEQVRVAECADKLIVTEEPGHIVATPALPIPADQAWFWTAQWQARAAEAEADHLAGNGIAYASEDEFLAALDDE